MQYFGFYIFDNVIPPLLVDYALAVPSDIEDVGRDVKSSGLGAIRQDGSVVGEHAASQIPPATPDAPAVLFTQIAKDSLHSSVRTGRVYPGGGHAGPLLDGMVG
jgi:hypothetical protein